METGLPAVRLLAAAALVLLFCPAVHAAPRSAAVELVWSAPAGCPREAAVRAEVERLAGRTRSAGAEAPVRAAAFVTYDQHRWRATIAITGKDESARQRQIEGETCAQVADATAVIIALALDPTAGSSLPTQPKAPPPPPPLHVPEPPVQLSPLGPPAPLPAARPALPAPQSRPMPRALGVGIKALSGVDLRSFPTPAIGVGLGGFLTFSQNRIEITASGWFPEAINIPRRPYAGAEMSLFVGSARYCRILVEGAFGVAGCGGMELGAITATSFGVTSRGSGSAFWLAPGLGLAGILSSSRNLSLSFEFSGHTPSFRRSFWITGLGEIYRPPELTLRAVFGAEIYFR